MDEQIDKSDRIISNMIDYSRERQPVLTPVDVEKIIESAIRRIDVQGKINVVKRIEPGLPLVLLDGPRITQALEAIMSNAADSMPSGGDLSIAVDRTDKYLIFEIRDTGDGISEHDLLRLSDPLFSTKNLGMGMGLPLADEVVKKHDGVINVSSVPGQGTTVSGSAFWTWCAAHLPEWIGVWCTVTTIPPTCCGSIIASPGSWTGPTHVTVARVSI